MVLPITSIKRTEYKSKFLVKQYGTLQIRWLTLCSACRFVAFKLQNDLQFSQYSKYNFIRQPQKSPPKKKKVQLSSDEEADVCAELDDEEPVPRPARQRRARAPTNFNFGDESDSDEQKDAMDDTKDWMGSDDDF